ncbi:MAG: ABC transporter permease subunit [bacterium]|nr:ABC transporter permease subunit [bacterium]
MMVWRLNPITRKRLQRFRRIRRGFYSFAILLTLTVVSLFSNFLANRRAIVVSYEGTLYFPTFQYHDMATFAQQDEYGFDDVEADYLALQARFAADASNNWVLMPPVPFDPYEPDFDYAEPPPNAPDSRHWFGTDSQGRDVLARLLYGFRISILFAVTLVFVGQVSGTAIGSLQGFIGGRFDIYSQRFIEVWSTLPFLYVVILLATFFRPGFLLLLAIMALFEWIRMTYYMRTEMYREKTKEYCLAARSFGASRGRLIFRHLLPNCLTPLVTITPFAVVGAISALTALDYLGYGLPAPTPSWGEMIDQALASQNRDKLWLSIAPFSAISITLLLVTLIGESIREAFDPKQYAQYR